MPALPDYLSASRPNAAANRAAWFKNTAPAYAGIFVWVAFYLQMAGPTLSESSVAVCLLALLAAGLLSFALFYYVPGMLGMQTGRPLYVIGSSTFGARGGYLMPGLLMGALQIGWFSVGTYVATDFILKGLDSQHWLSGEPRLLFTVICAAWGFGFAWVAMKGIRHIARIAHVLDWVPLVMLILVAWAMRHGVAAYHAPRVRPLHAFAVMLEIVFGFFATAGAAGVDFGMNSRHRSDVVWGGLVGITLPIVVAGGLCIFAVAGAIGSGATTHYNFSHAIAHVGALSGIMFFLFALACMVPTCFTVFISSNSFGTMLPKIPRPVSTFAAAAVGVTLAATGASNHLVTFFQIVGASFGPICGAMAADYLLAGCKWSGPRQGINWAGYLAWAVGFIVGIIGVVHVPGIPVRLAALDVPATLYSFIAGFAVYGILAKAGLRPPVESLEAATPARV